MSELPALDARVRFSLGEPGRAFHVDAELSLGRGVLVVFGPSGAGKTLTLSALAGLVRVDSGHIRVGDDVLLDTERGVSVPPDRRRIGYVPQSHALFPFLDVKGNVLFGLPRRERARADASELLRELGIQHLADASPSSLSGGERQRVALARALATSPRLLLLDEPFASIDRGGTRALEKVLRDVMARHDIPAVLVTHDVDEAVAMGDRVVHFEGGKSVRSGLPGELLARDGILVRGTLADVAPGADGRVRANLVDAVAVGRPGDLSPGPVELHVGARPRRP